MIPNEDIERQVERAMLMISHPHPNGGHPQNCGRCYAQSKLVELVRNLIAQTQTEERKRCSKIAIAEYARWRDVDRDSYGIACGAIGAAANIVAAIEGISCLSAEPVHANESVADFQQGGLVETSQAVTTD